MKNHKFESSRNNNIIFYGLKISFRLHICCPFLNQLLKCYKNGAVATREHTSEECSWKGTGSTRVYLESWESFLESIPGKEKASWRVALERNRLH